jgi:D-sedoheptulose 7-phosphate isomerase
MYNKIDELIKRYPVLIKNKEDIMNAYKIIRLSYENGGKLLIAGNGGSSSDADHIVGELMKGFVLPRKINDELRQRLIDIDADKGTELADRLQNALPAIALSNHNSLNTAFLNDVDGTMCFAQQTHGYGVADDVLLAISTSGNSKNIIYASIVAKAKGLKVIGLTGQGGGTLAKLADVMIAVDEKETYKIQELHLPIYHCLCLMLEDYFFG